MADNPSAFIRVHKTGTAVISATDVDVIFDTALVESEEYIGHVPTFTAVSADLPAVARNDSMEYPKGSGTTYTVKNILDDNTGLTVLRCEAV